MKQFKLPNKDEKIHPNEYKKNNIIITEIDGNIYILNDWLMNVSDDKEGIIAIAYSLNSNSIWVYKESMEKLIEYLLKENHSVYQFDTQKEFIKWLWEHDSFRRP